MRQQCKTKDHAEEPQLIFTSNIKMEELFDLSDIHTHKNTEGLKRLAQLVILVASITTACKHAEQKSTSEHTAAEV